ncbi:MAG: hypothetical protein K0S65_15, partial [Labilithrix sp.]|nr:hypothetical protein [Labilithrix sp.]
GDPRGELITLQLARAAGRSTEASEKREASLLKKYAKAWAGPLDPFLDDMHRVFEGGFLASGVLKLDSRIKTPPPELSDPAWSTVRALWIEWQVASRVELMAALLELPSLRSVRTLRGMYEDSLALLAQGPPRPTIEELDFIAQREGDDEVRRPIRDGTAFPALRRLAVTGELDRLNWLFDSPLVRRLDQRITLHATESTGPFLRLVEQLGLAVEEACTGEGLFPRGSSWMLTATRDDAGRFTRLRGEPVGPSSVPSRWNLERALESIAPEDLTELVIPPVRACTYDERDIAALERLFTRFPRLARIEVPWERVQRVERPGAPLTVRIVCERLGSVEGVPQLLKLVAEPPVSLALDSYAVNYGKHAALGASNEKSEKKVIELLERKRTTSLRLYAKGSSSTSEVVLTANAVQVTSFWRDDAGFLDAYLSWLVRMLDADVVVEGIVPFRTSAANRSETFVLGPLGYSPAFGWISVFGETHAKLLSFDTIEALPRSAELSWLRTARSSRNLVLVGGSSPSDVPGASSRDALAIALSGLLWDGYRREYGFVPRDLVLEILGAPLAERGFELEMLEPLREASGHIQFVARDERGVRSISLEPVHPMARLDWSVELRHVPRGADPAVSNSGARRNYVRTLSAAERGDAPSGANAVLLDLEARLDGELLRWLANPR